VKSIACVSHPEFPMIAEEQVWLLRLLNDPSICSLNIVLIGNNERLVEPLCLYIVSSRLNLSLIFLYTVHKVLHIEDFEYHIEQRNE